MKDFLKWSKDKVDDFDLRKFIYESPRRDVDFCSIGVDIPFPIYSIGDDVDVYQITDENGKSVDCLMRYINTEQLKDTITKKIANDGPNARDYEIFYRKIFDETFMVEITLDNYIEDDDSLKIDIHSLCNGLISTYFSWLCRRNYKNHIGVFFKMLDEHYNIVKLMDKLIELKGNNVFESIFVDDFAEKDDGFVSLVALK